MSDNLAVGHEAHPNTQLSPDVVGLRIMHRTTVKGSNAKDGRVIHMTNTQYRRLYNAFYYQTYAFH